MATVDGIIKEFGEWRERIIRPDKLAGMSWENGGKYHAVGISNNKQILCTFLMPGNSANAGHLDYKKCKKPIYTYLGLKPYAEMRYPVGAYKQ